MNKSYGLIPAKNIEWLVSTAIGAAKDEGYDISQLDYGCLTKIDTILKGIKKDASGLPDQQKTEIIHGAAIEYAAIIVKIIESKSQKSGKWFYHHKQFGEDTFPYVIGSSTLFPYAWTLKTIESPSSDSVKTKFDQLFLSTNK